TVRVFCSSLFFLFFQAEDGIRDRNVTGVQTCALPILPDQIIFLDASLDVLQERIANRNRSYEAQIEDDYLAQLKHDYNQFYKEVKNEIDAIQIDTSNLDFVHNTSDYQHVLHLLQPLIGEIKHDQ